MLAARHKRRAEWRAAERLWDAALEAGGGFDLRPWEELAKFYEHRQRELAKAREVTLAALARAEPDRVDAELLSRLRHRLQRLDRRISRRGGPSRPSPTMES